MTRRRQLTLPIRRRRDPDGPVHLVLCRRSCRVYAAGAEQLITAAGITRRMYDHTQRAWSIPLDHAADLATHAETHGRPVTITQQHTRPTRRPISREAQ